MESQINLGQKSLQRAARRIHSGADAALQLLTWLESEGFIAKELSIEAERKPEVIINLNSKCEWLKTKYGAYMHSRTAAGATWRCEMFGCRVVWMERGH
jgi:hypothetical protein